MISFYVNGKENNIPGSFSEFEKKHWLFFSQCLSNPKIESWHDVKIAFLRKFSSVPFQKLFKLSKSKKHYEEYLNHDSKLSVIYDKLNFLSKSFHTSFNPVPCIRYGILGMRKLFPPLDKLQNLMVWEMAHATKYSKDYSLVKNEKEAAVYLNKLIATLYRPQRFLWPLRYKYGFHPFDRRRKFFDSLIPVYEKKIRKLPEFKKQIILWWFNSAYKEFSQNFKDLFKAASNDSPDEFSWLHCILTMEGSAPGEEEKIASMTAGIFLERLVANKKVIENMKAKSEKNK